MPSGQRTRLTAFSIAFFTFFCFSLARAPGKSLKTIAPWHFVKPDQAVKVNIQAYVPSYHGFDSYERTVVSILSCIHGLAIALVLCC
jgi:hypothetical protein